MNSLQLTDEQRQALNDNNGIVATGDAVMMSLDIFREMFGFNTDDELRRQLQIGFDQADRSQFVDWNSDRIKAEGRQRLQQRSEVSCIFRLKPGNRPALSLTDVPAYDVPGGTHERPGTS